MKWLFSLVVVSLVPNLALGGSPPCVISSVLSTGSTYAYFTSPTPIILNFTSSKAYCESYDSSMIILRDIKTTTLLSNYVSWAWIGLNCFSGTWMWNDGLNLSLRASPPWEDASSVSCSSTNCAQLTQHGTIQSIPCSTTSSNSQTPFPLCEFQRKRCIFARRLLKFMLF
jgi:hypothetical protein